MTLYIETSELKLSPHFITYTVFCSNFIGVVFARTLHYQFYCWYFHTIPYIASVVIDGCLLYRRETKLKNHSQEPIYSINNIIRFTLVGIIFLLIEISFNVFPATWWSSALLQVTLL